MPDLATLALAQFAQRRHYWQQQRARGRCTAEEADARLYPWLAIALRCGADAAQLHLHLPREIAGYAAGLLSEGQARAMVADNYCPLADARTTLARARDAAIDALAAVEKTSALQAGGSPPDPDPVRLQTAKDNARALQLLARALAAPPYRHPSLDPGASLPPEGVGARKELA